MFYSESYTLNDYGTKLRIQCHKRIQRKEKSIDGESCVNWEQIDSFGVKLNFDDPVNTDVHENFYADPPEYWYDSRYEGDEVLYNVNICCKMLLDNL